MTTPRRSAARLVLAAVAAIMAAAALGATLVYRVNTTQEFRRQTVVNCRQIETLKAAIRDSLNDSRATSLMRASDPAIVKAINSYYDRQVARFASRECPNS